MVQLRRRARARRARTAWTGCSMRAFCNVARAPEPAHQVLKRGRAHPPRRRRSPRRRGSRGARRFDSPRFSTTSGVFVISSARREKFSARRRFRCRHVYLHARTVELVSRTTVRIPKRRERFGESGDGNAQHRLERLDRCRRFWGRRIFPSRARAIRSHYAGKVGFQHVNPANSATGRAPIFAIRLEPISPSLDAVAHLADQDASLVLALERRRARDDSRSALSLDCAHAVPRWTGSRRFFVSSRW